MHEPDNVFQSTIYRPVAPLYEHAEGVDQRVRLNEWDRKKGRRKERGRDIEMWIDRSRWQRERERQKKATERDIDRGRDRQKKGNRERFIQHEVAAVR